MTLFDSDRFEDGEPTPLVATDAMRQASETLKPLIVQGDRGTGKTSLLKGLLWTERKNFADSTSNVLDPTALAIYIKLPEHNVTSIYDWGRALDCDALAVEWIRTYYELLIVEALLRTLDDNRRAGLLPISADDEVAASEAVRTILAEAGGMPRGSLWEDEVLSRRATTFLSLTASLYGFRSALRHDASLLSAGLKVGSYARPSEIWAVPRAVVSALSEILSHWDSEDRGFRILVCCDEFEALPVAAQSALVGLLVNYAAPLLPIFAGTPSKPLPPAPDGVIATAGIVFRQLVLGSQDDFPKMAKAVVAARLGLGAGDTRGALLRPKALLGTPSLNEVLEAYVRNQAKDSEASANHRSPAALIRSASTKGARAKAQERGLPIYEAYLNGIRGESFGDHDEVARRDRSAHYRKFQAVAALGVFASFSKAEGASNSMWLAGVDLIPNICEYSIREYFRFLRMAATLIGAKEPEEFIGYLEDNGSLPLSVQANAARRASLERAGMLMGTSDSSSRPRASAPFSSPTPLVVDGLARLTSHLQVLPPWGSTAGDKRFPALRSPDRGAFVLTTDQGERDDAESRYARQALSEAVTAGWLVRETKGTSETYRVHRSLAVRYGFIYRRPQYDAPISPKQLWKLMNCTVEADRSRWARTNATLLSRPSQDTLL